MIAGDITRLSARAVEEHYNIWLGILDTAHSYITNPRCCVKYSSLPRCHTSIMTCQITCKLHCWLTTDDQLHIEPLTRENFLCHGYIV